MKDNKLEKELLLSNLKKAVIKCTKLKIGSRPLVSSFSITPKSFLDFTEEKYKDGIHSFRMDAYVEIANNDGDSISDNCTIHFSAQIEGTDVEIVDELVVGENCFIPSSWEL